MSVECEVDADEKTLPSVQVAEWNVADARTLYKFRESYPEMMRIERIFTRISPIVADGTRNT